MDGHNLLPLKLNVAFGFAIHWSVKVQLLVYWILAYRCLHYHQKHIELVTSDTAPVNLNWLKYLLVTIGGMLLLFYIFVLFKINMRDVFTPLMYLAGSLIILYYALAQKEVYPFQVDELKDISQVFVDAEEKVKPAKQRLTDEEANQLQEVLRHLMLNDKLYLDSELSLPQLAGRMEISVHDLSYLLNEKLSVNFFQFVNHYRVEEAKQLMASEKHKHLNILGIAYSAGFNAKTTFNTAFKKETGLSPSQFMQQGKLPQNIISSVE
jgi:AraC-like DNA-binding protein